MSSGSYFTIYRKHKKTVLPSDSLAALRKEYIKSSQNAMFASQSTDNEEVPLLMWRDFKTSKPIEDDACNDFYDASGVLHERLLVFHFCSDFTALKEKFSLNAYRYDKQSVFISKDEAMKILQAIEYILSREYSKKFEDILSNEYVELLGDGLSSFDSRFSTNSASPIYISKSSSSEYYVTFGDIHADAETRESDESMMFNLKKAKSCLQAFIDAESYDWEDVELVLEYSAY